MRRHRDAESTSLLLQHFSYSVVTDISTPNPSRVHPSINTLEQRQVEVLYEDSEDLGTVGDIPVPEISAY